MRHNLATAWRAYVLPLLACLSACATAPGSQPTQIQQALAVACSVDGVLVPIAQPIVATLGAGGAAAASMDALLVHPTVVAACAAISGVPATVVAVSPPVAVPPAVPAKPTN